MTVTAVSRGGFSAAVREKAKTWPTRCSALGASRDHDPTNDPGCRHPKRMMRSHSHRYRGDRRGGLERVYLLAVRPDDTPAGLGNLVPHAGDVAEGLRDDQPRIGREFPEQLA